MREELEAQYGQVVSGISMEDMEPSSGQSDVDGIVLPSKDTYGIKLCMDETTYSTEVLKRFLTKQKDTEAGPLYNPKIVDMYESNDFLSIIITSGNLHFLIKTPLSFIYSIEATDDLDDPEREQKLQRNEDIRNSEDVIKKDINGYELLRKQYPPGSNIYFRLNV